MLITRSSAYLKPFQKKPLFISRNLICSPQQRFNININYNDADNDRHNKLTSMAITIATLATTAAADQRHSPLYEYEHMIFSLKNYLLNQLELKLLPQPPHHVRSRIWPGE